MTHTHKGNKKIKKYKFISEMSYQTGANEKQFIACFLRQIFIYLFFIPKTRKKKMIVGNIIWFIVLKHPKNEVERV